MSGDLAVLVGNLPALVGDLTMGGLEETLEVFCFFDGGEPCSSLTADTVRLDGVMGFPSMSMLDSDGRVRTMAGLVQGFRTRGWSSWLEMVSKVR